MTEANEGCIFDILCESGLGGDIYHRNEDNKTNRELLKRRITDGRFLSFGISCQNCGTLSRLTVEPRGRV